MNVNMELGNQSRSFSIGTVAAIGAGAVAIVLAAVALGMEKQTRTALQQIRAELESQKTATANAEQSAQRLASQAHRAFQEVAQQIGVLDQRLNAFATRLATLGSHLTAPRSDASLPPPSVAPSETTSSGRTSPSGGKTYTVESGDNFAKIAKKLNVSVDALQKANPDANPTKLRVGQKLNVP